HPQLAVLHFPQRTDEYPETLTQTDFGPEHLTGSFANSGAVLRRSTYLQLPGFESRFFHMYEEPDYALQCVAAGYDVLFSPIVTIRHHYSGQVRNEIRNHHRHARNEFWSVFLRCPFPYAPGVALYRALSQFWYACRRGFGWMIREPAWWWQAMAGVPYCVARRHPVSWAAYRRWLRLPLELLMWLCSQLGAREQYAIPRALFRQGSLDHLLTDAWVPPGSPLAAFGLSDRFHPDLGEAPVRAWTSRLLAFELAARLKRLSGWPF